MRILIIEDDKSLAETLRFQLEHNQFETDVCHDGEEGLHFIEQQSHDLILLDRMLPVLDGISVLKIARERNISTPIIFVTALGSDKSPPGGDTAPIAEIAPTVSALPKTFTMPALS